jgi:HEAT repeat protein
MGALRPEDLVGGLRDPASRVRRRACDLAGRLRLATLAGELIDAVSHGTPEVTEAACYALGELAGAAEAAPAVAALAVTSRDHREPLCREAAVAALGALGIPEGLPAVLAALADKPAIRRRAVVALAAFEGDDVDAALVRAAQDPDWQVRQAAEDLLGDHHPPPGRDG